MMRQPQDNYRPIAAVGLTGLMMPVVALKLAHNDDNKGLANTRFKLTWLPVAHHRIIYSRRVNPFVRALVSKVAII